MTVPIIVEVLPVIMVQRSCSKVASPSTRGVTGKNGAEGRSQSKYGVKIHQEWDLMVSHCQLYLIYSANSDNGMVELSYQAFQGKAIQES